MRWRWKIPRIPERLRFSRARACDAGGGRRDGSGAHGHAGLDIDALETVLLQNRVKLILVTPDFHNPTGTALPLAQRRRLLEIAAHYQVPVIEDGIYARLRLRGNAMPSLKSLDRSGNVIQIDSFSKIAFPGLARGLVHRPGKRDRAAAAGEADPPTCTPISLRRRRWRNSCGADIWRAICEMKKVYRSRLEALEEALAKHMPEGTAWTRPEGGMSLWVTLAAGLRCGGASDSSPANAACCSCRGAISTSQHPQPNTLRLGFAALDEKQIARGIQMLGGSAASRNCASGSAARVTNRRRAWRWFDVAYS